MRGTLACAVAVAALCVTGAEAYAEPCDVIATRYQRRIKDAVASFHSAITTAKARLSSGQLSVVATSQALDFVHPPLNTIVNVTGELSNRFDELNDVNMTLLTASLPSGLQVGCQVDVQTFDLFLRLQVSATAHPSFASDLSSLPAADLSSLGATFTNGAVSLATNLTVAGVVEVDITTSGSAVRVTGMQAVLSAEGAVDTTVSWQGMGAAVTAKGNVRLTGVTVPLVFPTTATVTEFAQRLGEVRLGTLSGALDGQVVIGVAVSPAGQLPSPVLVVSDANIFDTTPPKVTVDADITSLQGTIIELLRQLQRFNIDLGALGLGSVELPGPDAGALNTTQLVGGVSDMLKLAPVAEQYFLLFAGVAEYPTFAGLMTFLRENLPVPQLSSSVGFNGIELTGGWFPQEGEVALRLRLNLGTQVPLLSFGGTISNVMGDMQQLSALFDLIGVQAPAQSLAVPDFSASVKFAADLLLDVTLGLKTQFINDGKLSGAALAGNAFLRVNDLSAAVSIAVDPVSFKADLPFASSLEVRDASFAASLGLRAAFGQAIAEPDPDTPVTATTAVPVVEITVLDLLSGGTGAAAAFLKQLQLEVYATLDVVVPVLLTSSFVGDRALSPIVELHDETLLGGGLPAFALDLDLAFLVPSLPGGGGGSGNSLTAVFSSLTSLLDDVAGLSLPTGSLPNIGGVDKLLADLGGKLAFTGELDTYLDLLVKFRRLTNNLNFALQLDTLDAESLVEATAFNIQVLDSLKLRFPSVFEGFTDELDNPTTNATFSVYGADFLKYIQVEFGLASTLGGADPAFGRQELVWFLAVNVDYALSADNALALIRVLGLEATFSSVDLNGFPVNAQNVKFNPTTYIADLKLQLGVTTATFDLGSLGKLLGGSVPTLGANIDFQRALFALLQARFPALSAKFDGVTVGDLLPIDTTTGTTFDWQSYLPEVASLLGLPSTITVADVAGLFGKRPTLQGLVRFLKARLLNGLSTGLNIGGNTFSAGLTTGNGRQELSALIGLRFNTPSVTALDVVQSLENMLTGLFSMVGQDNVIGSLDAISAPLQQALSGLSQHLQFAATANLVVEAGLDIQPLIKRTGAPQLFVRVHEFNFNITVAVINFPTPMNFGPGFDFTAVANAELTFSAVSNASAQSPAVLAVLIYDTLLDEVLADPQYSGCLTDTTPCPRAKATLAHFREAMKNRTAGSFTADGGLPATFVNGGLVGTEFQFGFGVGGVLELRVTPPLGELIDEDEFEFTGTGVLTARVTFGFGLDVKVDTSRGLTNVTLADITVALQNFTMGLEIQADVSATAKIGIISASVSGGTGTLAASFTGSLNGGNPTALADITSSNFAFSKAASLSACLPFSASIGSQDLGQLAGASPGQSPQVCVNDADLFDGTAPTITPLHMDRLFDFKGLTPLQILGIVRGVVNVVQEYRETPVFDLPIPFSDIDLGDMLDFADALSASLMQKMLKAQDVADRTTLVLCVESDALIADWNVAATNGSAAYQAGLSGKIFSVVMNEELQVELEPDVPALQAAVTIGEVVTLLNDALFRAGLGLSVQASQVASGVDAVQLCTNSSVKATDLRVQVALKQTGLAAYTADPTATGANTFLGFTDGDVKEVPRVPAFETIPELVVVLAEAIGVPQGALQVTYADPLGNGQYKLLFKLNLPLVLPAPTATLTLGAEVQPLFEVNASAEIALDTVATIGFELGARMGTTAGNLSLMATPPGGLNNFTLASALSFTLLVDRESFVVPLRAGQRLYDELSLQVAAVVSAGLVSRGKTGITVRVLNYKDSTFLIQTTGAKRLEARTSAAFEAVTGMGSDKSKALLFQPIVRNLNFVADMVLSVTNVNLEATLAVLQATSYGGAGAISLRAMAEFGTPGQTMLLGEIRDAIVEDPFSVVAANATVNAFLDVSVTVTVPKLGLPNFAVEGTVSAALNPPFFVELRPNFTLPNASDFEVSINAPALPNLSNFKNLSLAEIVSLIASGVDLIFGNDAKGVSGLLTGVDVLDLEIPVVSVRPRTVVTQLQTILGELEGLLADPAGGVKRMELLIETKLGLPDDGRADCTGSCLVEFQFSPTDNVFVLKLEYGVAPPSLPQLSLDMNLRELIGLAGITLDTATADALNDFVDLEASLSFAFEGSASATLELGVDLSSWPYRPFIGGETGVQLNLQANATGSLSLSLGPLEFAIENAEVKLDNGVVGAGSGPAFLRFGLQQGDRYYLSDGFSSIISGFDLTHTGIVKANLPIPVLSDTMSVEIPSIVDFLSRSHSGVSSGLVVFQGSPTNLFSSLAFNLTGLNPLAALLTDKEALLKGIEGMFTKVEFAIVGASGVLGSLNAPIVGDKIRTTVATDFLGSFKTQLIGELRAKLNQLTGSDANANVASALRDVMEVLFRDTLGILKGNTIPIIIRDESGVDITSSVLNQTTGIMLPGANLETADSLEWQITLGKDILFNLPFAFDLGVSELPLKLNVDGSVQLLVGWNFNLFFGMSVKRGFFFNVAGTDLEVYAGLTLPGLTAKGSLFILEADVTNIDTVTQLLGRVSVDVADVDGDGFLTFREIKSGGASLISAQASFEASLGMDLSLGLASPGLPLFNFTWRAAKVTTSGPSATHAQTLNPNSGYTRFPHTVVCGEEKRHP